MSKHPGPWGINEWHLYDANRRILCELRTDDPETRAILLHAGEMWEALRRYANCQPSGLSELHDKIEAEIATGRKP